jgi:predicted O-methyltransferase YrrM
MMRNPNVLSTIVLNWNRLATLRVTVESYLETIEGEYELFIVDNASTDGSRDYLKALQEQGRARVILLEENIGGLAYNEVLRLTSGSLIHLSENDQLFLPGWSEHVRDAFKLFPDLGQLSLFADIPTDYEGWGPKPSTRIRLKNGKVLYEAQYNLTTSAIARAELFFEHGVRVTNLEGLDYKFPADGKLSADIKAAGYWCAWSDHYYVRNLGHEVAEYEADPDYYHGNYASKPWVGVEGWQERIASQKTQPKLTRASLVHPSRTVSPEKALHAVREIPSRLWSRFDSVTAESEVIDFIFSLVRLIKPVRALETGTWLGLTAIAIGKAMKQNGFGYLTSIEIDPEAQATAAKNIVDAGVHEQVTSHHASTLDFPFEGIFDFAYFDTSIDIRQSEFARIFPNLAQGATIVIQNTRLEETGSTQVLSAIIKTFGLVGTDLETPRGLWLGKKT